jgi:hypothetical protein
LLTGRWEALAGPFVAKDAERFRLSRKLALLFVREFWILIVATVKNASGHPPLSSVISLLLA